MAFANARSANDWRTLTVVRETAADYFDRPIESLCGATRIDELSDNEIQMIHFTCVIEGVLNCDIPDLDVSITLTLAQLATLAEKYKVKP